MTLCLIFGVVLELTKRVFVLLLADCVVEVGTFNCTGGQIAWFRGSAGTC